MKKEALYLQIRENILKKIKSGYYKPGDIIPKEIDLADYYNVSRPTVAKAVHLLVEDGLLERIQKTGTIVKQYKINQEFTHEIKSYNNEMVGKGYIPRTKVLFFKSESASYRVAKELNLTTNDLVYKIVRLRYIDTEPIVLVTTYLPQGILPSEFSKIDFSQEQLYDALAKVGYPVKNIKRNLEVTKSDETISDLLSINIGDPIFYFCSTARSIDNTNIEFSISKYRGDLNSFKIELDTF